MKRMLRTSEYARYSECDFDNSLFNVARVSTEQIRGHINLITNIDYVVNQSLQPPTIPGPNSRPLAVVQGLFARTT